MGFAIHWYESAMGLHVFPILNPPPSPSYPSGWSQCTSPEHPVSCIEPGLAICFIFIFNLVFNYHCFTELCWFLPNINIKQPQAYICCIRVLLLLFFPMSHFFYNYYSCFRIQLLLPLLLNCFSRVLLYVTP